MSVNKPILSTEAVKDLHQLDSGKNTIRILIFGGTYFLAAWGAVSAAESLHGLLFWICAVPCWLLAGASLHGISLFTHEAVHGTLSKNRSLNAFAGALFALPVWQNYSAYRILHLRHHNDLGGEHDPDHYSNYTRWTWGVFIRLFVAIA